MGQNIVKSQIFRLGFVKFSLCCISVYGFIQSNTMKLGGLGKDTCFSDEMQCPYEDSCESLNHSWQRKESAYHLPQLLQCMDRVIQYKLQFISTMTLEGHPCIDDIPLSYGMFFLNNFLEYFLEGQKPMYIVVFTNNIYIYI